MTIRSRLHSYLGTFPGSAREHRAENAAERRERLLAQIDVRTECSPIVGPPSMKWSAVDANADDAPVGFGVTREAAIEDLLEQLGAAP